MCPDPAGARDTRPSGGHGQGRRSSGQREEECCVTWRKRTTPSPPVSPPCCLARAPCHLNRKDEADTTHSREACSVEGAPVWPTQASAPKLLQKLAGGGLAQERKRNFADGEGQMARLRVREVHTKTQCHLTPTGLAK